VKRTNADPKVKKAFIERTKRMWTLERRKAQSERAKRMNADPKVKKAFIERVKCMHADPKFKRAFIERVKRMHADPKVKKAFIERVKRMHADPKFKRAFIERVKRMHADPKFKKAHIERVKRMHADPKFKKAHIERMKRAQAEADPKFKKAFIERVKRMNADPKFKKAHIERAKRMHADPKFREKMLPIWRRIGHENGFKNLTSNPSKEGICWIQQVDALLRALDVPSFGPEIEPRVRGIAPFDASWRIKGGGVWVRKFVDCDPLGHYTVRKVLNGKSREQVVEADRAKMQLAQELGVVATRMYSDDDEELERVVQWMMAGSVLSFEPNP